MAIPLLAALIPMIAKIGGSAGGSAGGALGGAAGGLGKAAGGATGGVGADMLAKFSVASPKGMSSGGADMSSVMKIMNQQEKDNKASAGAKEGMEKAFAKNPVAAALSGAGAPPTGATTGRKQRKNLYSFGYKRG